ncbi:uncharacterized protein [Ptychodera flava]|uniref:uncharacterized protein n=1 Tax=Ptychodera flava TaxID=63121 RepID=UPI00396A313B
MGEANAISGRGLRLFAVWFLMQSASIGVQGAVIVRDDLSAPGQDWNAARLQCNILSGDLAKITDFNDNGLLCSAMALGDYYIGLVRIGPMTHEWLDNTAYNADGWNTVRSDGDVGADNCVVVRKIAGANPCMWYSKLCDREFGFVCDVASDVIIVPPYSPVTTQESASVSQLLSTSAATNTMITQHAGTDTTTSQAGDPSISPTSNDCTGLSLHEEWACVSEGILSQSGGLTNHVADTYLSFVRRNPLADDGISREDATAILQKFVKVLGLRKPTDQNTGSSEEFDRLRLRLIDAFDGFGNEVIEYMKASDIEELKIAEDGIVAEYIVIGSDLFKGVLIRDEEMENKLKIPANIHGNFGTKIGITSVIFGKMQDFHSGLDIESTPVVSKIFSCSVFPKPATPLRTEVEITFRHHTAVNHSVCVYLDAAAVSSATPMENSVASSIWATDGCRTVEYSENHTVCKCNHLTSFAVLMQPTAVELSDSHQQALSIITYAGCSLSVLCLFVTFATLVFFRLASDRVLILQNTIVALLLAQLTFIVGINATKNRYVCMFVAVLLHYLFLAAFSWMLAQGIHLFIKARAIFISSQKLMYLCALGWGIPLPIVAVSAGIKWDSYGNQDYCWLSMTDGMPAAFIVPAMLVVVINIIVLIMVLRAFMGVKTNAKKSDTEKIRAGLRAAVILVPLLGLTWLFGLFAVNEAAVYFQYLFSIANSLQGFFIFLFHCFLNEEVRSAYHKRFGGPVSFDDTTKSAPRSAWQESSSSNTKISTISPTTTTATT